MAGVDDSRAQKLDLQRDKKLLTQAQIDYIRAAQALNAERVTKLKRIRRNNLLTAGFLGASVLSIYGYSLWAIGSEKFLEEEEKPQ
ncbi:unnamed protein product [Allacma fusca]|uniref:Cytochrome c oxidase assembly factor 3 n=1 Tax=Allacma fusca TaxID=39272 RepID=A0A8J2KAX5_9HEXA|nr:unnamed protein product [Allacma fusca]